MRFIFVCFFGLCLVTQDDGSIHTQRSLASDFRFFDIGPPTYSITLMLLPISFFRIRMSASLAFSRFHFLHFPFC